MPHTASHATWLEAGLASLNESPGKSSSTVFGSDSMSCEAAKATHETPASGHPNHWLWLRKV